MPATDPHPPSPSAGVAAEAPAGHPGLAQDVPAGGEAPAADETPATWLPDAGEPEEAPAARLRDYLPALPALAAFKPAVRAHYREWAVLALILVAGAIFRFTGIDWDSGQHLHPDERFLTMVEDALRPGIVLRAAPNGPAQLQPASLLSYYFDTARSGLNPHNVGFGFFVYGTFPLFAVYWLGGLFHQQGYGTIHLFGRMLSGLSDLTTVALLYMIGRRLYGARTGLLAAALLAFCVMHIQQAHFFVFDSFLVTLIAAAFYCCVDIAETGRLRSFALAGLFLGLALATKLSMVLFAPVIALAGAIFVWRRGVGEQRFSTSTLVSLWERGLLTRAIVGGLLALFVAALTFRIFQPYAFSGPGFFDLHLNPRWLDNIIYQQKTQDGTVDLPPSIQWAGTTPLLFPWRHMVAWGMGIPLGLTVWAGFVVAGAVVLWRGRWQHLLVVFWAGLCFVYFASVLNKTMRYLLPSYPFFILLGAWLLVALYDWAQRRRALAIEATGVPGATDHAERYRPVALARAAPYVAAALAGFVVLASAAWSYAFTRIYTRPTTRVAASLWIYQNLPKGTVMVNEHWDDPIPVPLPGYDPGQYRGPLMTPDTLPLYDPDDAKKIDTIVRLLAASDYINTTSNRLYKSIPRIPQRYPMTTEYYRRLFAGDLGFKLVKTFSSYPQLGPWVINDDRAEEAFTVYDHPKVLIFQKQPDFSPEKVRATLSAVPLDNVVQLMPAQVGKPDLMLSPDLRAADTAGGTWSAMFNPDGIEQRLAPLLWWLVLELLGLLAAPLVWRLCTHLPDRGYGLAKPAGLLAVSWLAWWLSGVRLLPWTRTPIVLAILALAAASAAVWRRCGTEWRAWLHDHRRLVLASETLFLGAFVFFCLLRAFNPDLWHPVRGGEKPMELSYLNAVIKSTYFPPYDPWFAGGYLNYYYFGYVLVALLTKLTGVLPSIAFNLAIPSLYGLTAVGCCSFAYNLVRLGGRPGLGARAALGAGLLGFALVAFFGNLDGFSQLLEDLARAGQVPVGSSIPGVDGLLSLIAGGWAVLVGGRPLQAFDYWRSSRIIPNNTINEFPFWTFLFSDLHAHLISFPYQVLALGWLLNLVYGGRRGPELSWGPGPEGPLRWALSLLTWRRIVEIVATAWLVGALYVINSWEFPTYLLLSAAAFLIAEVTAQRGITLGGLVRAGLSAAGVLVLARPLYWPFWKYYLTFYSSVTLWTIDKTRLDHYLIIHGVFIFALVTLLLLLGLPAWRQTGWGRYLLARWRWLGAWERFSALEARLIVSRRPPAMGYALLLTTAVVLVAGLLLQGLTLIAFLCALLALTIAAAWERRDSPALLLACLLTATGLALGIFVEFFTLQGDVGRMNTVFKFYLQVWIMWGLVSAAALVWTLDHFLAMRPAQPVLAVLAEPARSDRRGGLLDEDPVAAGTGDGETGGALALPSLAASTPDGTRPLPWSLDLGLGLRWWQWCWLGAAGALLLAALAFPLGGTPARLADRFNALPPTLDGMAYMQYATLTDASAEVTSLHPGGATLRLWADFEAIRWMQQHISGSPVVLEASVPEYRWGARVAKYTGLPAVLGWRWHQVQQRGTYAPLVDQRLRDVQTMFNDPSPSRVVPLLEKYHVRYIYVGDLERAYYSAAGLAKFDQLPGVVPIYQRDGVTIYEVQPSVQNR